eukprot:TRINITY_DN28664_c0_g1_i1.p1 TRINITY_DN28664_c0_g1~~TRINITY_DN28664_c0_g1_i1.p1  ORF type:complete len:565 (-),score=87.30 TRINITY_DN28664_c0_g1_i1:251-1945(-)
MMTSEQQQQQQPMLLEVVQPPPTFCGLQRTLLVLVAVVVLVIPGYTARLSGFTDFSSSAAFIDAEDGTSKVVQTKLGPIHGACAEDICRWLHIPFSEPFARFEKSMPRTSSYGTGVGSGTRYGPACLQFIDPAISGVDVGPQSEDCLSLNVFAPASASQETNLPVMVFIYGGGFLVGSSGQSAGKIPGKSRGLTYDGSRLASHDVLVVVIQYRLGLFGFLQQPDGGGGANGIGDQITALQWVNRHISAFGGNPHAVTIFGESAGSTSVSLLSHLPKARGLFQRVIPESGVCYETGDVLMTASEAKQARESLLNKTGLKQHELMTMEASALSSLTMHTFDPRSEFTPLFVSGVGQPSIDGDIFPDVATKLTPLPVDVLHGFNSGEVQFPLPAGTDALSFFTKHLGSAAQAILAQYGPQPKGEDIIADACIRCQSLRFAQRVAKRGGQAHFYVYDNPSNASTHGAELPAVFGTADEVSMEGMIVKTSESLVQRVQRIWTDFAKGQNISNVAPGWPQVRAESFVHAMRIGEEMNVMVIPTTRCAAWEAAEAVVGGLATARMCNAVMV